MKKYLTYLISTLLILPFIIPSGISAQWYIQYSSSGSFINDIRFIDKNTGWACGSNLILKTTNGGTEWIQQNGHGFLWQIHPVNDTVVYACGSYIILKTTDGGLNWVTLREGTGQVGQLYGLWFTNENSGWFCGDRVTMRTTTGGLTFIDSMYIDGVLNDMHFKNDSVGNIAALGSTFRTTNSGINWYSVELPSYSITPFTERVTFVGDTGWTTTTGGYIYRTTNYGVSWDSLTLIQLGGICIEFADQLTGYAGGSSGLVYKTTDGGFNWDVSIQAGAGTFSSIFTYNDSIVWTVGGPGGKYIFNTINGGLTNIEINYTQIPNPFQLYQNYPNPFNSTTVIPFKILITSDVELKIYDVLGKEIYTILKEKLEPGYYKENYNGDNLNSGVYFYTIKLFDKNTNSIISDTKKFLILK